MELILNICDKKNKNKIVKKYKTETVDFSFGVVEDVLNILDFDSMKTGNNKEIAVMVVKAAGQLKPFLKELFPGVTDEEIRCVQMSNLVTVFRGLVQYATQELNTLTGDEKN
ncbi:MAG: hypothetical protein IJJ69_08680 [Oscillospiraceae bacterium]|nr:hypothetical protein [Oscillospiraceae bacterium]